MKGYYNRPDATAETMSGPFLRTGDLASLDERGRFYIRDRLKELIKVKGGFCSAWWLLGKKELIPWCFWTGFQVPPAELEALLLTHPNVADCAVISIPDEVGTAGELPKAYVVERSKSANPKKAEKELQDYVAGKVAHYKRLTGGIEFVESVPKSASGKILRRVLRDMEKERREKVKAKL